MSHAADALDALIDTLNEHQLDGFGPWRETGPAEWEKAFNEKSCATASFEIVVPRQDPELAFLVADPEATNDRPVFDEGAAADRARDVALDDELGVTR